MWPHPSTRHPLLGPESPTLGGQHGGSPESATTCFRPHCELRVPLASSLVPSWGAGRWEVEGGSCPSPPAFPGHPPRSCLLLAGHPGKPGPACLLAHRQAPEMNGWCKWVSGSTARPRRSPAGSLRLRPPLWATLPSGPPRPPRLQLQAYMSWVLGSGVL